MKRAAPLSILALGIFVSAWPALGHHSFAAEFDSDKPVQVAGAVTKVEWANPHARFYIDVKDDQGNIVNWNIELGLAADLATPRLAPRFAQDRRPGYGGGLFGPRRLQDGERQEGHAGRWPECFRGIVGSRKSPRNS